MQTGHIPKDIRRSLLFVLHRSRSIQTRSIPEAQVGRYSGIEKKLRFLLVMDAGKTESSKPVVPLADLPQCQLEMDNPRVNLSGILVAVGVHVSVAFIWAVVTLSIPMFSRTSR